jgi:phage/plasmid-associated DNA primase
MADMVRNAVEFHKTRELRPPAVITNATREYRQSEDTLGQYFDERVVVDSNGRLPAGELFANYNAWAESLGLKPAGSRTFGEYTKKVLECVRSNGTFYMARVNGR